MTKRTGVKPPWWRRRGLVWACSYITCYAAVLLVENRLLRLHPYGVAGGTIEWGGAVVCLLVTTFIIMRVIPATWWATAHADTQDRDPPR